MSKEADKLIEKLGKQTQIEGLLNKGIYYVDVYNADKTSIEEFQTKKLELMTQIISDPQIAKIMTEEQNLQKIKHRFVHKIKIFGTTGIELMDSEHIAITPDMVYNLIQKLKTKRFTGYDDYEEIKKLLNEFGGNNYRLKMEGEMKNIQLIMTFRKE